MTDIAAAIGLAQLDKLRAEHGPPAGDRRRATTRRSRDLPIGLPVTPDGRTHVFHQYTIDVGRRPRRDRRRTSGRAGVGADIYYPIPVHRQAYIMERGLHADLPGDRRGRRADARPADVPGPHRRGAGRASSTRSGPPSRATPGPAPAARRGARRPMTGAAGAPARIGLAGLGAMGRNHLRILSARPDVRARRRRRPGRRDALDAAAAQTGAQGFAEPLAMIAEAELDAVVIAAPTTAHVAARARRDRARASRSSSRSRSRPRSTRRCGSSPRPASAACPVQVGHVERFNPAVLELGRLLAEGWLSTHLLDRLAPRRPVPGPDPRRRRDRRPRDPRRRHPVAGSPASGRRASTPRPPSGSTPTTRTSCSGCSTSRPARPACSTSTG